MGYLQNKKGGGGGPSGSSGIISVWVKAGSDGKADGWRDSWYPPHLISEMRTGEVAFPGASYWYAYPQLVAPVLRVWPPGPGESGDTFRAGLAPFLSWGNPKQGYDRCVWKKRVLRDDFWLFGCGGVGQKYVAQYPMKPNESPGEKPGAPTIKSGADAAPELGVVPLSCFASKNGELVIILQTGSKAKYTGFAWAMESAEPVHVMTATLPKGGPSGGVIWRDKSYEFSPGAPNTSQMVGNAVKYRDVSSIECTQHPETFYMETGVNLTGGWHHILFSYDLGGESHDGFPDATVDRSQLEPNSLPKKSEGAVVEAKATGPKADPPLPGPYGQYSGINGEYELAPFGYMLHPENPDGSYSYRQQAAYGRPFEDNGLEFGPADGGEIKSKCKAWLMVDGQTVTRSKLHHRQAWNEAKYGTSSLGTDCIVPVNALVTLSGDPRLNLTTNQTGWERDYRTLLGGFNGPASRIENKGEKRRFSYDLPKYELSSASISGGGFAIPAGTLWDPNGRDSSRNIACEMAELFIWNGKWADVSDIYELFVSGGGPASPRKAAEVLGNPSFKLHWATNWMHAGRKAQELKDESTEEKAEKFSPYGTVSRYYPGP